MHLGTIGLRSLPNAAFGACRLRCQASETAGYIHRSVDERIVFASGVHLLPMGNGLSRPGGRVDLLISRKSLKRPKKVKKRLLFGRFEDFREINRSALSPGRLRPLSMGSRWAPDAKNYRLVHRSTDIPGRFRGLTTQSAGVKRRVWEAHMAPNCTHRKPSAAF